MEFKPAGGVGLIAPTSQLATIIIGKATDNIIDRGRKIASFLLETGEIDIEFERGRYRVAGTDREVVIFEVAAAADTRKDLPEDLKARRHFRPDASGRELSLQHSGPRSRSRSRNRGGSIIRYTAVDYVGHAINPLIL
jgi:aerobic carbon-monoxide dehydrogenase large subunit